MITLGLMYEGSFTVLFDSQQVEYVNKNEVKVMSKSIYLYYHPILIKAEVPYKQMQNFPKQNQKTVFRQCFLHIQMTE